MSVSKSDLHFIKKIATGYYGDIYKAQNKKNKKLVAVKKLKKTFSPKVAEKEVAVMRKLPINNRNIVRFYGTYRDSGRLVIVTEFVKSGSLDIYIQVQKENILKSKNVFQRLLKMAMGACAGMAALESLKILHCDLACRNLLVGSGETIKVCDFGLSRITANNVYQADPKIALPVKWSAPEVLDKKRFSNKSDVWSFGCCLYEIFSFGKIPYGFKTDDLVAQDRIIAGKLPGKRPPQASASLFRKVFLKAWKKRPNDRPSFKQLRKMLKKFRK